MVREFYQVRCSSTPRLESASNIAPARTRSAPTRSLTLRAAGDLRRTIRYRSISFLLKIFQSWRSCLEELATVGISQNEVDLSDHDVHAARHVFGTIVGLNQAYNHLRDASKNHFHAHLTMLDIHDAPIARDLCLLMLLHDLSLESDVTSRAEIKATLLYMYCGAVMPSYCYDRYTRRFPRVSWCTHYPLNIQTPGYRRCSKTFASDFCPTRQTFRHGFMSYRTRSLRSFACSTSGSTRRSLHVGC